MLSVTVNQPIPLHLQKATNIHSKTKNKKDSDIVKGKHLQCSLYLSLQQERVNLGTDGPSNLHILTNSRPPASAPSDVGASLGRLVPN